MSPKYPDITVELTDHDGNAFAILGRCRQAAQQADMPDEAIATFMAEAMDRVEQPCTQQPCCRAIAPRADRVFGTARTQ